MCCFRNGSSWYPEAAENVHNIGFFSHFFTVSSEDHKIRLELYLSERGHVTERSVLDDLIGLGGVAQLGVALDSLRGQADAGGLAAGQVWRVQVVVSLKYHQLALGLGDMCGEGLQDVAECHLHLHFQLSTSCQTGGKLHFVKVPSVRKQTTEISMEGVATSLNFIYLYLYQIIIQA